MPNRKLTPQFDLVSFFASDRAEKDGIKNPATLEQIEAGENLHRLVLAPLLEKVPDLEVSSWFRCKDLNALVGGSKTSEHLHGGGVDIISATKRPAQLIAIIIADRLPFDQLIPYSDGHLHIGWRAAGNRSQVLKEVKK